jgi:hypothetical protein
MMADSMFEFKVCTEPGCESTSAFSFYNATTLRLGYKFCVEHMNELAIKERLETDSITSNKLFIFYTVCGNSVLPDRAIGCMDYGEGALQHFYQCPNEGSPHQSDLEQTLARNLHLGRS